MMRRRNLLAAAATAAAGSGALLSGCGSPDGSGVPTLDFLSLAWQEESVKACKALVAQWNTAHPEVQVRYVQGSWDDVHDQLLTSFEGGAAPDVIHDEGNDLTDFGSGGYLADLTRLLPAAAQRRIPSAVRDMGRFDGGLYGVPFLQEPRVLIADRTALDRAGIDLPDAARPWTWEEFEDVARELSHAGGRDERYGVAWPMSSPVSVTLNLSLTTGGRILYRRDDGSTEVRFGQADSAFAEMVRRQVGTDRSAPAGALGMSGGDTLPGFFAGRYAMLPLNLSYRQQIHQQAPAGFDWVTLPLPAGTGNVPDGGRAQGVSPQTLSVSKDCRHQAQAAAFIDFMTQTDHLVRLARGDWMAPTGTDALRDPSLTTGTLGWSTGMAVAAHLVASPALGRRGYPEWSDKVATPALQEYFSGAGSLDSLRRKLVRDGNRVFDRYRT
jgi:ABC-type glycerol-3-phosphate transport system substrate-binding protein